MVKFTWIVKRMCIGDNFLDLPSVVVCVKVLLNATLEGFVAQICPLYLIISRCMSLDCGQLSPRFFFNRVLCFQIAFASQLSRVCGLHITTRNTFALNIYDTSCHPWIYGRQV